MLEGSLLSTKLNVVNCAFCTKKTLLALNHRMVQKKSALTPAVVLVQMQKRQGATKVTTRRITPSIRGSSLFRWSAFEWELASILSIQAISSRCCFSSLQMGVGGAHVTHKDLVTTVRTQRAWTVDNRMCALLFGPMVQVLGPSTSQETMFQRFVVPYVRFNVTLRARHTPVVKRSNQSYSTLGPLLLFILFVLFLAPVWNGSSVRLHR